MSLKVTLSQCHAVLQGELFPLPESKRGPLPTRYQRFVELLEFVFVDLSVIPGPSSGSGRPLDDRWSRAQAFLAKAVFDVPATRALIERLQEDGKLRRLCGWIRAGEVPSESTFSRAFAEFAASALPERRSP